MRAELKKLHSPDIHDLTSYQPDRPFGILVQMMIGPEGVDGEESFDTIVCSPDWMSADVMMHGTDISHKTIVDEFNHEQFFRRTNEFCQSQKGDNWKELTFKISQIGKWEFAGYKKASLNEVALKAAS